METAMSSSSGSRSRSSGSPALLPVKPELQETLLGRRTRSTDIVINEPLASSRLVKPKTEPGLLPVKQDHLTMAVADEAALKWARDDYAWEEIER
ncbi:SEC12-like protein 2 [Hordeum vulgare]|nr:SEC12-like protein 2 [Hordeum vulgare]